MGPVPGCVQNSQAQDNQIKYFRTKRLERIQAGADFAKRLDSKSAPSGPQFGWDNPFRQMMGENQPKPAFFLEKFDPSRPVTPIALVGGEGNSMRNCMTFSLFWPPPNCRLWRTAAKRLEVFFSRLAFFSLRPPLPPHKWPGGHQKQS
jgi:hypothetical protein